MIDSAERRYFGLFPSLDGEHALRLQRSGADSVDVVTVTDRTGAPARLRFSADEADALADLLTRYETLFLAPAPSFQAFRLAGLIRWNRPYQDAEAWATLTPRAGPEVRGVLLHADEHGLVVSPGPLPFRTFRSTEGLVWVRAADVLRVRHEGFWSRLDLRPSGDPDRYRREALPALQKEAVFVRGLPPELEAWRQAHTDVDAGDHEAGSPALDYGRLPLSRWRVALRYGPGRIDAGATRTRLFGGGGTVVNEWGSEAASLGGRVDYAVTPAVGVGVAVGRSETGELSGLGLDARQFSATAVDLTASYAVLRPQLRQILFPSVAVRGGASVVRTTSQTTLGYYWPSRDYTASAEFSERGIEVGATAGVEVAFQLSRGASVLFGYDVAVYPWAEEGPFELQDPQVNLIIKTVEPRTFSLRQGAGTVGIAIHLGGP